MGMAMGYKLLVTFKKKNSSYALTLATIGEVNGTKGKRSS